jgi:hypothetical protein
LHVGHGGPPGQQDWERQRRWLETFVAAVEAADWSEPESARAAVAAAMMYDLPSDELAFLMELSVDPVASRLGLVDLR